MGPALQGIFVGQGPCALPGVQHKTGGRTGASAPTEVQQEVQWAGDRKGRPYGGVTSSAVGGRTEASAPTDALQEVRASGASGTPPPTGGLQEVQRRRAAGWGHPALRSVTGSAVGRDDVGLVPYGCIQGVRGKWRIYRGLPGEGQREGNFWLNWGEGREVF